MDIYMSFSLKSLISFGRKIFTLIILMLLIHETEHRMSFQCTCMGKYWCFMYLCIYVCMCISVDVCVCIYLFSSITFISVPYLNLFDWIFPRFFIVVIINGLFLGFSFTYYAIGIRKWEHSNFLYWLCSLKPCWICLLVLTYFFPAISSGFMLQTHSVHVKNKNTAVFLIMELINMNNYRNMNIVTEKKIHQRKY